MQPVSVFIDVPQSPERVYAFLDVMGNHEQFTDHMLRDWRLSGPSAGVGARADVTAVMGGRTEPIAIEVVEAQAPRLSVERNVGAGGRRIAHGTYRLEPTGEGGGDAGTRVTFEYAWQSAPLPERLAAPLVRALMRRGLARSMERLRRALATAAPAG